MTVGITGNSGTGKTLVADFFSRWGARIIHADRIGWEILEKDEIKEQIFKTFDGLNVSDSIDRKELGNIVFRDLDKLEKLNSIVHPPLLAELQKRVENLSLENEVIAVEAALIFEWGIQDFFDYTVLLTANKRVKRRRLKRLGVKPGIIEGRLHSQIDAKDIKDSADFVIENNGGVSELKEKARDVWNVITGED